MPTLDSPTLDTVFFDYDRKPLSRHPMTCLAIYGKGGIGKSTTAANVALALAQDGRRVMLVGCDPKADSTALLRGGAKIATVLSLLRTKHKSELRLDDMVVEGKGGVLCGGFAMPIRDGWARNVFIITSGENMAIHAAANIATAVETFAERGYARLGGIILNARDVPREAEKVEELACDLNTTIVGRLPRSAEVQEADALGLTVLEHAPSSGMADRYRELARRLVEACAATRPEPARGGFTF